MTRSLDLAPSPYDGLDPVAAAIRWWTSQLANIAGKPKHRTIPAQSIDQGAKRLPRHAAIGLAEIDCFVARARLPKGSFDAHRNALMLQIKDLAPTPVETLKIVALAMSRGADGSIEYALTMARRDRLDGLEAIARRHGARSVVFTAQGIDGPDLLSPRENGRRRRVAVVDTAIAVLIAISAAAAVTIWTARLNAETEAIAHQEKSVRRSAVSLQAAQKEGELTRQLAERGVLNRRANALLETLATLNTATPSEAWWIKLRWTPDEIAITGQAPDATRAIAALSATAKNWSVELAGPLAATGTGGTQTFDLIVRPREARKP